MDSDQLKLRNALKQWRDSLVNMSGRNRLLNYRPTRSSTLEFVRHTSAEVFDLLGVNDGVFAIGTKIPAPTAVSSVNGDYEKGTQLEDQALDSIEAFDYDKFPARLFVDKTQREVDRGLKNLANVARREYLDKGLSVLYLALGAMRWIDDANESRRSPLIFVPVELRNGGPKQPHQLYLSDEDRASNPALALKLREFGLELPSSEAVDEAIEVGGLSAALNLYRELDLPEGWEIEDLVSLSTFMFAKEAMFRDLETNEDRILESPILNVIADAQSRHASDFAFEIVGDGEIDRVAPPELTPMVLDADSSQRAAIAAARAGRSFVLDGPPGTGKSQTIANIIATLINDGKRVLFVSEKAVALDVVRDRLDSRGLGSFLFELHSHRATRSEVASRLAAALENIPVAVGRKKPALQDRLAELRNSLNDYAAAINEVRQPLDCTIHEAFGALETVARVDDLPSPTFSVKELNPAKFDRIKRLSAVAAEHWDVLLRGEEDIWAGLEETESLRYDIDSTRRAFAGLHKSLEDAFPSREVFGISGTSDWKRANRLFDAWHVQSDIHDPDWLSKPDLKELSTSLSEYTAGVKALLDAARATEALCGTRWREMPTAVFQQSVGASLDALLPSVESKSVQQVIAAGHDMAAGAAIVASLASTAAALSTQVGLRVPGAIAELDTFIKAVQAVLASNRPNIGWLASSEELHSVEVGAQGLREAVSGERVAKKSANEYFTDDIRSVDARALERTLSDNASIFRRFKREASDARRSVARFAVDGGKKSIAHLPLASAWQVQREVQSELEGKIRPLLGAYSVQGDSWTATTEALQNAKLILASAEIKSSTALQRALSDEPVRFLCGAYLDDLRNLLSDWRSFTAGTALALPIAVREGAMEKAQQILLGGAEEAGKIGNEVGPISAVLGVHSTLEQIWRAAESRNNAAAAEHRFDGLHESLALILNLSVADPTDELTESLARKLEWSQGVRTAASKTGDAQALTAEQVLALSELPGASGLAAAGAEWEKWEERLRAHFTFERGQRLLQELESRDDGDTLLMRFLNDAGGPDKWLAATSAQAELAELGVGNVVEALLRNESSADSVAAKVEFSVLRRWINYHVGIDKRLRSRSGENRDDLVAEYRKLDQEIIAQASSDIVTEVTARRPSAAYGQSAVIRREGEKKRRHIPVRQLVNDARDVIQAIHPCFMMSPLAVSQYLPSDIEFDVVIFDEASQVTPGDAINCIYRGKALIAAGDQRQLPPTSFFSAGADVDEDDEVDDLANDYESILDLMKSSGGFSSLTLRWHYRSRHEHLIAYSNNSFYDDRLVTFPGAVEQDENLGVQFHLVDGQYRRSAGQDNPREAQAVASRVINHFEARPNQSLGVVAFSAAQRDCIENAIAIARAERPDLDRFFQDDRLDGLFVKSLEEVQGDERDVIILSIGYGPDESGKVYRNFGPINRKGGERRLNVAITRARRLIEVVSSMTAAQIGDTASEGGRHLRRYLDFAERGPKALSLELGPEERGTDSPFEDSVISAIRSWGYEVQPQVGVAGFRIDIGVKHPNAPGVFMLGVECDGAMYHSSRTARDRDRLRHEVLEGLGWEIHHIWGTAWYRNRDVEKQKLKDLLEARSAAPIKGRLTQPERRVKAVSVRVEKDRSIDQSAGWIVPYEVTRVADFPRGIELSETHSARHLVPFVKQVVKSEGPIHVDVLTTRLREHAGIGRVGRRIRATLDHAVQLSGYAVDNGFLLAPDGGRDVVRASTSSHSRAIEHVHSSELERAIRHVLRDAAGATRSEAVEAVVRALGWNRTSATMSSVINDIVDISISRGEIRESGARLTLR